MLLPSLTPSSVPISGRLCFPSPSSLPPGAPDLEGSGHSRRDAEVPGHRGVSAAGAGDTASALSNQLPAWVGEVGGAWGSRIQDVAGSQHAGAIGCWQMVVGRGAHCGKWLFCSPRERLCMRMEGRMLVGVAPVVPVVTSKVTGMGRQVPKSCMVREEHVAAFPLHSPKISTPTESALCS